MLTWFVYMLTKAGKEKPRRSGAMLGTPATGLGKVVI